MIIKSLENTEIEKILEAFNLAFSNYELEMQLSLESLRKVLKRNSYCAEYSFGAFDGDRLVGFILSGLRVINGKKVLYDSGTGVLAEYRKKGIATKIFEVLKNKAKANDIKYYLLEALKNNSAAINVYKNIGFCITREFNCYHINKELLENYINTSQLSTEYELRCINADELTNTYIDSLKKLWTIFPSWQNDFESVQECSNDFICVLADDKNASGACNKTIGYGIISKKSGEIVQLAVSREYHRRTAASLILKAMLESTKAKSLVILNVDDSDNETVNSFDALGFNIYTSQYEMIYQIL